VRFADVPDLMFRAGHLSDRALVDVCMTGERPAHLDRCDICADRAIDYGRWLDDVRAVGDADVDAVFPAERLAAQQAQIMRRLEQLDQPARVIAFPRHMKLELRAASGHRVSAGWIALAAAAGLLLGVAGDQFGARWTAPRTPATATLSAQNGAPGLTGGLDAERKAAIEAADEEVMGRQHFSSLESLDQATPTALPEDEYHSVTLAARTNVGGREK
jgi:hypothetical protein